MRGSRSLMESLSAIFRCLRQAHRKALIPFIVGGDPTLSMTSQLLLTLEDAGADLIELGIPFSDPLADGPVIQGASARSLAQGATPQRVMEAVARVRHRLGIPVVALSYWNPIVQYGGDGMPASVRAFLRSARDCGLSGLIVPDLPVEEGGLLRAVATREGIATIFLAAPTSPSERLRMIARASEGFIYYVSVTGTTGMRGALPPTLVHGLRQLRLLTSKPVCVGFGISTPSQAATVARIADGVIVGSALIHALGRVRGRRAVLRCAAITMRQLRRVI